MVNVGASKQSLIKKNEIEKVKGEKDEEVGNFLNLEVGDLHLRFEISQNIESGEVRSQRVEYCKVIDLVFCFVCWAYKLLNSRFIDSDCYTFNR